MQRSQLGAKFRRQHSIGPYVVDNYCPQFKLAIEIDGQVHNNPESYQYDQSRTHYLQQQKVTVVRFTNNDIMNNLDGVLEEIKTYLR